MFNMIYLIKQRMDIEKFRGSPTGKLVKTAGGYWAFVPGVVSPQLQYADLVTLLSAADQSLGELKGIGQMLPNPNLLIAPYMRKEAVLSSRIEGTQASLSDLFLFEMEETVPPKVPDVLEVRNYVKALNFGLKKSSELPLSLRLVRETHKVLMEGVRGKERVPGELRQGQVLIGPDRNPENATYIPPPPPEMKVALDQWEKFLHKEDDLPVLVKCAVMHYWFEAIHPFWDGNGRIGRLLIILYLCAKGVLPKPLLYLSAFFERHRDEYYQFLLSVSQSGDWRGWLRFFLEGVIAQAADAIQSSQKIVNLRETYRGKLLDANATPTTLKILDEFFLNPFANTKTLRNKLKLSFPVVQTGIESLQKAGIIREITGWRRNRVYFAEQLLNTIEENKASVPSEHGEERIATQPNE